MRGGAVWSGRLRTLIATPFLRNVGLLTGGTAFAQGLTVLVLPVLTRLYSPEDFALLAVYAALLGIVAVIACLRLNLAIPLPEEDRDALNLLVLSLLAAAGISLLLLLPALLAPAAVADLLGRPDIAPFLWLVAVGTFFAAAYNALQFWATRQRVFGTIAATRMTRSLGGVGIQLGWGAIHASPAGLILGHIVSQGFGVVGLTRTLLRTSGGFGGVTPAAARAVLARYRRFPLLSVPEALCNTAGVQIPVLLIAAHAVGPEAGFVLLAMRVMGLPMGLIGASVAQVYIGEAPARLRQGSLSRFTLQTIRRLALAGTPPLIAVGAAAPFLAGPVFGADWAAAGQVVAWMVPWFVLQFAASPVSAVLHVLDRLEWALALQAAGLVLRVGMVTLAATAAPGFLVEAFAISGALFYGAYLAVVVLAIRRIEAA